MDALAHALDIANRPTIEREPPPDAREGAGHNFDHGLLKNAGFGRTDTLPVNLLSGSYVLPADIVSGLGQGNTMAGAKVLDRIFADMVHPDTAPHKSHKRVPIIAAGGEYVVRPEVVTVIGDGDLDEGLERLDKFVVESRERTEKTLGKLPGPAKD